MVLVPPYKADDRNAAMVQFPGGYIAEIHSLMSERSAGRAASREFEEDASDAARRR